MKSPPILSAKHSDFNIVPFTTLRDDGPHGAGPPAIIDYDPNYHYFNFTDEDRQLLRPWRSSTCWSTTPTARVGHIFFERKTHQLYAIDHGICFHEDDKLRTVLWDFGGQKDPRGTAKPSDSLSRKLLTDLQPYLSPSEVSALCTRAELFSKRVFPRQPRDRRAMPWPPL